MLSSKKFDLKRDFAQVFICLRPPSLLGFCLGWSSNFLGSESSQIPYSVLNSCKIWSPTGLHTPTPSQPHTVCIYCTPTPSQPHTVCIYCTLTQGGGGELNQREGYRGNSSQTWVKNTNMTDCISSL